MTRKTVESSVQQGQPDDDHWLAQWVCSLTVIVLLIGFGLSGQILPRFVANQCTSEQGMCTPGDCTCPFPLMKRDLVTQDAQACSQCVEEFCPAVPQGDPSCSTSACECEDASWPRIDVGSPEKPCWQCVHPHKDVILRGEDGDCLELGGANRTCTVFRYTGAVMLDKNSGSNSCLTWSSDSWQVMPCQGTPESSMKFNQRGNEDIFCTGRGKQCLHVKEYMCTTDPSQCSTEMCRCEDPTHLREEMQTVNRSTCYLCTAPLPECPMSPAQCSSEPCECKPGFFKARQKSDEACFSCQPGVAPFAAGFTSFLGFLSAGATFLLCAFLGVSKAIVGDPAPNTRRKRRGSQPRIRTWSENCALYLEDTLQVMYEKVGCWKPLKRVSWAVRKVEAALDACDAALDPVYTVLDAGLENLQQAITSGVQKVKKFMGQADGSKTPKTKKPREAREKESQKGPSAPKEPFPERTAGSAVEALSWDPINTEAAVNNEEWMNHVVPSLSQRQSARIAKNETLQPTSAVQRLRQRREAKAQAAEREKAATPATSAAEAEVDESWIDLMELKEAKEREAKEKAAAQRRERKHAAKTRRAKVVSAGSSPDADQDEAEDTVAKKAESDQEQESQAQGPGEPDLLLSEAIHGMFLLAASEKVRDEKAAVVEGGGDQDEEVGSQVSSSDSEILPKESFTSAPDLAKVPNAEVSEDEDGWTKSISSRSRVKRRSAAERAFSGPDSGRTSSEQEPAAEPDPQPASDDQPEDVGPTTPSALTPQADPEGPTLSKRQKQRLRQRATATPAGFKPAAKRVNAKAEEATRDVEAEEAQRKDDADGALDPSSMGAEQSGEEKKVKEPSFDPNKKEDGFEEARRSRRPDAQRPARCPGQMPKPGSPQGVSKVSLKAKGDAPMARAREGEKHDPEELQRHEGQPDVQKARSEENLGKVTREKRAWSEVVAPWAKRNEVKSNLGAGAPEFVPLAQQLQELGVHDSSDLGVTTVTVCGLSAETTATGLFQQLDCWGLGGSFDFLHIMPDEPRGGSYANINFIDPIFVSLFCCLCQEYQLTAEISVSEVQGIKALTTQWVQSGDPIQAVVVRNAMPSQWAVNTVNTMLSPQLKGQFRKTKLCGNHKRNRCELGANCPFAHSQEELQPMPDLMKTKMCYNYFRRRCNDPNCKFAHGSGQLRSVWAYPIWPMEVMQDFDFSQMQAYPYEMCSEVQEESQGDAFSAERAAVAPDEQGDSILFEALPRKDEGGVRPMLDGKVELRVRRTFMEVMQVEDDTSDDDMPMGTSMRRSFSDSHLEKLKEAMDEESEL